MSDDYGTDDVPEGDDYDYSKNVLSYIGAAAGAYFVAKMFVMRKATATPKKTTEGETLMMYSANTMNWIQECAQQQWKRIQIIYSY